MKRFGMKLRDRPAIKPLFGVRSSRKSIPKWIFGRARLLRAAAIAPAAALLSVQPAHAEPVSTFFIGLAYGLTGGGAVAGTFMGALGLGYAVGGFLATPIGGLLLSAGLQLLGSVVSGAFADKSGGQQQVPSDSSRVNVRIESGTRWLHAGLVRAGGSVIFGEYDSSGAFWYMLAVGDSECVGVTTLMFDDLSVDRDGPNVMTAEFCLTASGAIYEGVGTPIPYYQAWTFTFQSDDPLPDPMPSAFTMQFSEWTANHKMAGVTLALVRVAPVAAVDRYKVFRWRGPFGLGEPSCSIVGLFSRVYDPRDIDQDIDDPTTWLGSRNPALIWAWFRTHPYGFAAAMDAINWELVGDAADHCDVLITDKYGSIAPRYVCGISIPDNKPRSAAEAEILASCDGALFFDDTGRAYLDAGVWREPSLGFSKARDIMAMSSREAQDGESETDGVVVTYIEPSFGYIRQPAAPWLNPDYYDPAREPNFMTVEILSCQNHNQAVRLAKAIGQRSQAMQRLAPVVGLRGLLARRERIVSLDYDDSFSGNYEIVSPVELDEGGFSSALNLVPVDQDRWTLLPGEEGDRPAAVVDAGGTNDLALPGNLGIYAAIVPGSGGSSVRLEAVFDPPARIDNSYQFEYRKVGETAWRLFVVVMRELIAYSDTVEESETYEVRYRTVSSAGAASEYIDPVPTLVATADAVAPGDVTGVSGTGGVGIADIDWTAPSSANYFGARIHRHTINSYGASTLVRTEFGSPSTADTWQNTGLAAGTYYYWVQAINGSGVASSAVATGAVVVT